MNQILSTENPNNRNNNSAYKTNNSNNLKSIIIIFAIIIGIFGLALVGIFAAKSIGSKEKAKATKPEIILAQSEDNTKAIIQLKSTVGLKELIYYFDETDKEEIPLQGKTEYEIGVDIPNGENTLTVIVTDNNDQTEQAKNFYIGQGDAEKPIIKIESKPDDPYLTIIATDETEMGYITYEWEGEEPVQVQAEEGSLVLEEKVKIQRGTNKIIVKAVDASGNITTEEKKFVGRLEPQITVFRDETKIHMKIQHDMGFKKVEFSVNGQVYTYDENYYQYNPETTELYYTFDLIEGTNEVAIIAISNEETENTYTVATTYP